MIDPFAQGFIGKQLGRYRIEALVAAGGMGVVFKGVHVDLGRPVAIKIVKPGVAVDEVLLRRLTTEARIAAGLDHRGIAAVHDIGQDAGYHYLVMDYIPGPDLGAIIERESRLDVARALHYVEEVASALNYAHELGVIHRDIKPSNILLGADGRPVITDFGIAKAAAGNRMTATGAILGTPEYMAPEQAQGRESDGRADLYALGVVFYEMITARLPFEGDTPIATAVKHITEDPVPATRWVPSLPVSVQEFLRRSLAKDPFLRFQSGAEMARSAAALRRHVQKGDLVQAEAQPHSARPGGRTSGRPPSPRPEDRRRGSGRPSGRRPAGPTVEVSPDVPRATGTRSSRPSSPPLVWGVLVGGAFAVAALFLVLSRPTGKGAEVPGPGLVAPVRPPLMLVTPSGRSAAGSVSLPTVSAPTRSATTPPTLFRPSPTPMSRATLPKTLGGDHTPSTPRPTPPTRSTVLPPNATATVGRSPAPRAAVITPSLPSPAPTQGGAPIASRTPEISPGEVFATLKVRRNAERHPDGVQLQLIAAATAFRKGAPLVFTVRLVNLRSDERRISFPTGQLFDLAITGTTGASAGDEVYRWSQGQGFSIRRQVRSLSAGAAEEYRVSWAPPATLAAGNYRVHAMMLSDHRVETWLELQVVGP